MKTVYAPADLHIITQTAALYGATLTAYHALSTARRDADKDRIGREASRRLLEFKDEIPQSIREGLPEQFTTLEGMLTQLGFPISSDEQ